MYRTYYRQIAALALRETIAFAKRRVVFAICTGIGIAIALAFYGATHLTIPALLTNLKVIVSCYVIMVVLYFVWAFIAAPVSLDHQLRTRLTAMQTAESIRGNQVASRQKFATLMEAGQNLHTELNNIRGEDFHAWDALLIDWQGYVRSALEEIGFPADYQEFMRAINEAEPLGGVINRAWKQENRRRKLNKQQQKLEEIAQRRLS